MAADVTELLQSIGGGTGGGALLGGLLAKYFMGKTDKEIEQIKIELQNNKDADALRDTAIELLKKKMLKTILRCTMNLKLCSKNLSKRWIINSIKFLGC